MKKRKTKQKPQLFLAEARVITLLEAIVDKLTMLEAQSDELRALGEKLLSAAYSSNVARHKLTTALVPPGWTSRSSAQVTHEIESQLCPLCADPLVKRARKSDGRWFLSCKNYPDCTGSRPYAHPDDVANGEDQDRQDESIEPFDEVPF